MFDWLRRRRLSNESKRKLLIITARSEEALIETHVQNILYLLRELSDEVDVDRALELYAEMIPMDEHTSATVENRVLARFDAPEPPHRGRDGGGRERDRDDRYRGIFGDEKRR